MACGAYGCVHGCPRCYGGNAPGGTGGYGEVDPAAAQGYHQGVEQFTQRGLLGPEGAALLHQAGEVVMPAQSWQPPKDAGGRVVPAELRHLQDRLGSGTRPVASGIAATTPIGGGALAAFAIGGVAAGKFLGALLRRR